MSTKISITNKQNIHIYEDTVQDLIDTDIKNKTILLEISDPHSFSFNLCSQEKNNSKLIIEVNYKDFEFICKEYLMYTEEKS